MVAAHFPILIHSHFCHLLLTYQHLSDNMQMSNTLIHSICLQ